MFIFERLYYYNYLLLTNLLMKIPEKIHYNLHLNGFLYKLVSLCTHIIHVKK